MVKYWSSMESKAMYITFMIITFILTFVNVVSVSIGCLLNAIAASLSAVAFGINLALFVKEYD